MKNKVFDLTVGALEESYGLVEEQAETMSPEEKERLIKAVEQASGVPSDVWASFLGKHLQHILGLIQRSSGF